MPPLTNQSEVLAYLKRRLGGGVVCLEITDEQFTDAIEDAIRLFNHHLFTIETQVLAERTGSITIDVPSNVTGVLYVNTLRPESYREAQRLSVFEIMYRMVIPTVPIGQWYLLKSFYEMYQRVRGAEPTWFYDRGAGQLHLDLISGPYDVWCVYTADITLPPLLTGRRRRFQDDFLKTCLAYAKETLARVRGKFGDSLPAPGGNVATDANVLLSESRADLEKIEASLQKRAAAYTLPMWG